MDVRVAEPVEVQGVSADQFQMMFPAIGAGIFLDDPLGRRALFVIYRSGTTKFARLDLDTFELVDLYEFTLGFWPSAACCVGESFVGLSPLRFVIAGMQGAVPTIVSLDIEGGYQTSFALPGAGQPYAIVPWGTSPRALVGGDGMLCTITSGGVIADFSAQTVALPSGLVNRLANLPTVSGTARGLLAAPNTVYSVSGNLTGMTLSVKELRPMFSGGGSQCLQIVYLGERSRFGQIPVGDSEYLFYWYQNTPTDEPRLFSYRASDGRFTPWNFVDEVTRLPIAVGGPDDVQIQRPFVVYNRRTERLYLQSYELNPSNWFGRTIPVNIRMPAIDPSNSFLVVCPVDTYGIGMGVFYRRTPVVVSTPPGRPLSVVPGVGPDGMAVGQPVYPFDGGVQTVFSAAILDAGVHTTSVADIRRMSRVVIAVNNGLDQSVTLTFSGSDTPGFAAPAVLSPTLVVPAGAVGYATLGDAWRYLRADCQCGVAPTTGDLIVGVSGK